MPNKTYHPKKNEILRKWHLIDAKGQILGRLATKVSALISGKGKISFSPHVDCGDFVVVINAEGIRITGNNKPDQKIDFRHSHYPGGHTITPYRAFLKEKPERAISLAVSGMLSKTRLRKRQMTRLKVYRGDQHPHGVNFAVPKPKTEASAPKDEK